MEITYKHIKPVVKKKKAFSTKLLISPYYGCTHNCLFCPANNGFLQKPVFDNYVQKNELCVVDNILEHIENNLYSGTGEVQTLHLSPVADPFQPAEKIFGMSRKIIEYCVDKNINLAICTKGSIPESIIPLLKKIKKVIVQVTMYTPHEHIRKLLVKGDGASTKELINNLEITQMPNVQRVLRIDPIFPYITDSMDDFKQLVDIAVKYRVECVLSSVADIVPGNLNKEAGYLDMLQEGLSAKYKRLYTKLINGRLHANLDYRMNLFTQMREICRSVNIPFGITWEPNEDGNSLCGAFSDSMISELLD